MPDLQVTESRQVQITRTFKDTGRLVEEQDDVELIEVTLPPDGTPLAHISYGGKFTKNLGNFNSVSIDIRLTLPTVVEDLEAAYGTAKNYVDGKLEAEHEDLKKNFPGAFK